MTAMIVVALLAVACFSGLFYCKLLVTNTRAAYVLSINCDSTIEFEATITGSADSTSMVLWRSCLHAKCFLTVTLLLQEDISLATTKQHVLQWECEENLKSGIKRRNFQERLDRYCIVCTQTSIWLYVAAVPHIAAATIGPVHLFNERAT